MNEELIRQAICTAFYKMGSIANQIKVDLITQEIMNLNENCPHDGTCKHIMQS